MNEFNIKTDCLKREHYSADNITRKQIKMAAEYTPSHAATCGLGGLLGSIGPQ
jgi:hypothetical protein